MNPPDSLPLGTLPRNPDELNLHISAVMHGEFTDPSDIPRTEPVEPTQHDATPGEIPFETTIQESIDSS